MRQTLQRLADNWEQTALWVASLVCVCFLLAWLVPAPLSGNVRPETNRFQKPSILGPQACAFLSPDHPQRQTGAAFQFAYELPEPPPVAVVKKKVVVKKKKGGPEGGVEIEQQTGSTSAGDESSGCAAPPQKSTRLVRYLGTYESTTGKLLAAVTVRNPKTGSTQTQFLHPGQTCGNLRVDTFDGESLRVLAPDGTRATVTRGAEQTVTMD